jgi:uncharacterized membrane protein YiaA
MSSFGWYLIGFIIVTVGLAMAAYLLNIPGMWIGVGVVVLVGIGVLSATSRTKMRDPSVGSGTGTTTTTYVDKRPPTGPTA